jgi:hypothetical protein
MKSPRRALLTGLGYEFRGALGNDEKIAAAQRDGYPLPSATAST